MSPMSKHWPRRQPLLIFMAAIVAALVLAACPASAPAGAPADSADAAAPASTGQREIVWMVRTNPVENPWEQNVVIPAFEEEYPDIRVNLLIIDQPEIALKREAMIAAGEPLHVWSTNWGGDGFASDRYRGLLTDLTPLIERDNVDMSAFIPEVLDIYNIEGSQWGLPFLTTGSYLFYNMDIFDEAGIPYPTTDWEDESWTWDAVLELAQQLTENAEDPMNATYGWNEDIWPAEGKAWLFGAFPWEDDSFDTGFGQTFNIASPQAIEAFQKRHDLFYVHQVHPDPAASEALGALGGAFQSGRVAMNTTGGWGWWVYSIITPEVEGGFCWGAAPLPYGAPGAENRAVIFTDPWVITRGLEGQALDDSWEFVKFLIREDNAREYMLATNTPPAQHALLEEWYEQFECMSADDVREVYQGAFRHGLESSNHMMVRFDELNQTWDNLLSQLWNDPNARAADILPEVEAAVTDAMRRIAEEENWSFD
jgi:multiple sugar transport system substrate-binding protein